MDQGKPLAEAVGEVIFCAEHRRVARRGVPPHLRPRDPRARGRRAPDGAARARSAWCAAFSPWNFPFNQAIRKIAAAVGAGCSIIAQGPGRHASAVVALAAALPRRRPAPGVLNIVWGVPSEVRDHLIGSPVVRKITFTGSVQVGKHARGHGRRRS
jgi:succinate-semialdehyde dehydrogenase/glutarate-semialdehyde dehydrogenase